MSLLFNLTAVQPIHSAKFHGGGSYGEVIFWAMVKRGEKFSCVYDSRKYLDPKIIDVCKGKNIPLFDIAVQTPQEIIDANKIDTFYTPLYSLEKKWNIKVKRFVLTWHGARALEMQYSPLGISFAKKFSQKAEALVRYRESWKRLYYKPKYQELASRIADGRAETITVSEHSRASIKSFFPELMDKEIPVFYSPMIEYEPEGFLPPEVQTKKYFLLTSGARWEKNNLRAAKAFDELVTQYETCGKPFDFKMIITGAANPKVYLKNVRHRDRFVLLGYVENKELEFLHKNAYAFVFPSLNEGFGYPPMQSMRYGVPVAASGTTSVPEICENAALLFDPYSVSEIKNRMIQLLDSAIYELYAGRAKVRYAEVSKRQKEDLGKAVEFILD
ncbi:MAG: glycosyltransferase [Fibrobacter sp.]|nr:glycosyltransferase [Fibrobacter sp.]